MDQRTQFLIQVLEKIGAPLTMAVVASPESSTATDAQRVAELLNKSVQLGLSLADGMNVRDEAQADGVHLSLAAFSGPLIANQYMGTGRVPGDLEVRRMAGALQAVLTFADNFTPAADTTLRIENSEAGTEGADEALIHVQMLNAFAPMLQAIAQYTFGRQENKLVQDVAGRIMTRVEEFRGDMFGKDISIRQARRADLVLVKMMSGIYASAHMGEMARLMGLPEKARMSAMATPGGISMDPIWQAFDRQMSAVQVLAELVIPPIKAQETGGGSGLPPKPKANPMEKFSPAKAEATTPAEAPKADAAPAGNPMAFFAKKSADGS